MPVARKRRTVSDVGEIPANRKKLRIEVGQLKPRNARQAEVKSLIETHDLSFLIGPAGTAKTFLAVAHAVDEVFNQKTKRRIVAARPAIEAGDPIGFLKGDLTEKMTPYMRPVLDALGYFLGEPAVKELMEKGILEITSMTYLRGRSLVDTVLILDEIQNATKPQLKLALTRAGDNTRMIVTGDPGQIDLRPEKDSAIYDLGRFSGHPGIAMVNLGMRDVVRSQIVKTVLEAYGD